ncbi:hypothetical protein [Streptacidiphilus cavernicola]|uniref:Helix-turn-helix domain-containing protein n=1 Tax=Streptacidiphilus cavernicola TaxID=3342716 RepID=A0ABV6VYC5_9ACTN
MSGTHDARRHEQDALPEPGEEPLSGTAVDLYALLRRASSRNFHRPVVEISRTRAMEALGCSQRSVERAQEQLAARGLLTYQRVLAAYRSRPEDLPDRYTLTSR